MMLRAFTVIIGLFLPYIDAAPTSATQQEWQIESKGAAGYLSSYRPTGIEVGMGHPIGTEYLYIAVNLSNEHSMDARISAIVRVSNGQSTYLGGCAMATETVIANRTHRFVCPVVDAVTNQALTAPVHVRSLQVDVDIRVERWREAVHLPLSHVGLNVIETGLEYVPSAVRDPHCRWYQPRAVVESPLRTDVGISNAFLFLDSDGVVLGRSGEGSRYHFPAGEIVEATARMNPCFDPALPQPEKVEIVLPPL